MKLTFLMKNENIWQAMSTQKVFLVLKKHPSVKVAWSNICSHSRSLISHNIGK